MDAATLAADLHALLVERGETVASAESLTGGGLADLLSSTPGASSSYVGGVVSYATSVKVKVLGVDDRGCDRSPEDCQRNREEKLSSHPV